MDSRLEQPPPPPPNRVRRWLYVLVGWTTMGLAILGVALPLLPTTPFLLLSAACFARSSPTLHQRLLDHPRLGPVLRTWRDERAVPRSAKRRAYGLVVVAFAISITVAPLRLVRILLVVIGACLMIFLVRLPEVDDEAAE